MRSELKHSESTDLVGASLARQSTAKDVRVGYAFKQQVLHSWRPKPTLKCAISVYLALGLIFFALGIAIIIYTYRINEQEVRYDNISGCQPLGTICTIPFNLSTPIVAPVFVYYQIDSFYQNHRRYIKTIPVEQLRGQDLKVAELGSCDPILYNKDIPATIAVDGSALDPDAVAIPCGNAARGRFTDTFTLRNTDSGNDFTIASSGFAWQTDVQHKFKNVDLSRQWLNMEDERFMTWMKISPFSKFRKSWGIINQDMPAGQYELTVHNRWDSYAFSGKKWFVLADTNGFAGRNQFLGYCYIAVGAMSILLCLAFIFRKLKRPKGILDKVMHEMNFVTNDSPRL